MKNKTIAMLVIMGAFISVSVQAKNSTEQTIVLDECTIRIPTAYHLVPTFDGDYGYLYKQGDIDSMSADAVIGLQNRSIDLHQKTPELLEKIRTFANPIIDSNQTIQDIKKGDMRFLHQEILIEGNHKYDIHYIIGRTFVLRGFNVHRKTMDALYQDCLGSYRE